MYKPFSIAVIRKIQQDDKKISPILQCKLKHSKPPGHELNGLSMQSKLLHEWERLYNDEDGILPRKTASKRQLLLAEMYKSVGLKELHDEVGHQD